MADLIICENETLADIASAIKSKTGSSASMSLSSMPAAINGISGGTVSVPTTTVRFTGSYNDDTNFNVTQPHPLGGLTMWGLDVGDLTTG